MIKFGVMSNSHPASAADLSRLVDEMVVEAQQAEKYGFDSFFVTEHHQEPSGYLPSPLPLLAALAARTSTIRLGTGIAVLPLYHPVRMAEDCAVIDIISKGRLILGVGMGYQDVDFAAYGLRVSERVSLFEEGVEIIKRAWTEEKLSFVGKRYTLTNISVTPKPVQKPRPPIWVAAVGDEAMKRAGRVGDALLADSFQLPARLKPRVACTDRRRRAVAIARRWCCSARDSWRGPATRPSASTRRRSSAPTATTGGTGPTTRTSRRKRIWT